MYNAQVAEHTRGGIASNQRSEDFPHRPGEIWAVMYYTQMYYTQMYKIPMKSETDSVFLAGRKYLSGTITSDKILLIIPWSYSANLQRIVRSDL